MSLNEINSRKNYKQRELILKNYHYTHARMIMMAIVTGIIRMQVLMTVTIEITKNTDNIKEGVRGEF